MHELMPIPRPSQLDDWQAFEKLEAEMVRCQIGEVRFMEWKAARLQEMVEQERFERFMHLDWVTTLRKQVDRMRGNGEDTTQLEMVRKLGDLRWKR